MEEATYSAGFMLSVDSSICFSVSLADAFVVSNKTKNFETFLQKIVDLCRFFFNEYLNSKCDGCEKGCAAKKLYVKSIRTSNKDERKCLRKTEFDD